MIEQYAQQYTCHVYDMYTTNQKAYIFACQISVLSTYYETALRDGIFSSKVENGLILRKHRGIVQGQKLKIWTHR